MKDISTICSCAPINRRVWRGVRTISHGLAETVFAKVRAIPIGRGDPKGLTSCQVVSGGVNEPHVG